MARSVDSSGGDGIDWGDNLDIGTSDWSAMIRWKSESGNAGSSRSLFSKGAYSGTCNGFFFYITGGGNLQVFFGNGSNQYGKGSSGVNPHDNIWHSGIVTLDRDGNMELYYDGQSMGTTAINAISASDINTAEVLQVFLHTGQGNATNAALADAAMWNRVLTAAECFKLNAVKPSYIADGLVFYAELDANVNDIAGSLTGNVTGDVSAATHPNTFTPPAAAQPFGVAGVIG